MLNFYTTSFLNGFVSTIYEFYIYLFLLSLLVYYLISYCVKNFGIYKITKRRKFNNAYLAWFPFARYYILGKISDDINKSKNTNSYNRVILLTMSILLAISEILSLGFILVSIFEIFGIANMLAVPTSSDYLLDLFKNKFGLCLVMIIIVLIFSTVFKIFYCICANNIFKDLVPRLSNVLCVLVILITFIFKDPFVDSVIFLSISTNEPLSLKNIN